MPMETFASPRFAGDPVLEEILNDPDTGTKKLQPGSPAEPVRALQQALFDLGWTRQIRNPEFDPEVFVIGVYGPITTRTVLAYKTKYRIHFPPDAPTGFIDGLAGPGTLRKLDGHMVLYDEADAALETRVLQILVEHPDLTFDRTFPVLDTEGAVRLHALGGTPGLTAPGGVWYRRGLGAFWVRGLICAEYIRVGAEKALGFPREEEFVGEAFPSQVFEFGVIRVEHGEAITTFFHDEDVRLVFSSTSF